MTVRLFQLFLSTIRRWRVRKQSIRQLMRIDDRLLRDIGLEREDIPSVVDALMENNGSDGSGAEAERATSPRQSRYPTYRRRSPRRGAVTCASYSSSPR